LVVAQAIDQIELMCGQNVEMDFLLKAAFAELNSRETASDFLRE
jgi:hypothetical protein